MKLEEFMVEAIANKLADMEGQEVYGCDLGYAIFEEANVNGSYTCSAYKAKEWIKMFFDELGEVVDDIKNNLGDGSVPNPFDNPEAFQVVCMLELSSTLLGQCRTVGENWNNLMELTEETINQIIAELNILLFKMVINVTK